MKLNDAGKIANGCWIEIPKHFPNAILHEYVVMPNHVHGIVELVGGNNVGANNHSHENDDAANVGMNKYSSQNDDAANVGANNHSHENDDAANVGANNHSHENDDAANVGANKYSSQNVDAVNVGANNHSHENDDAANVGANNHSHGNDDAVNVGANNHSHENDDAANVGMNNHSPQRQIDTENKRAENFPPLRTPFKSPSKTIGSIVRGFKIGVTKWCRQHTDTETIWQRNYHEHIIRNEQSYLNISEYIINNPSNWKDDKFYNQ